MKRTLLKSKIHRGTVTEADLAYEGSLTLDPEYMRAADILPYEKVHIVNINNGARLETYAIEGVPGSKTICLNGAAARLGQVGDRVIVMSYVQMKEAEARNHEPTVVLLDEKNNIVSVTSDSVAA
ncbi:MAG: aspartate 1-decarboxylase [Candidatus Marinimicrobia bacterium]|nr:aspartate 1-decarboxylase [Candidatus Neomarinimicrobiota bacterium]MCF7829190.1 aspartate 1-decarboxylase [Candidatus Neomarinimicrobiota bacterium]MCF7881157.1 aspartate 1-decarboxylase [Candidatus Neomarinimicrobiota bacterium]